jgi:hypothetical protein
LKNYLLCTSPGSIQARGENLFNLVKAFTNPMLLKENEISNKAAKDGIEDVGAVFFDYLTWFMVSYSVFLHICRMTLIDVNAGSKQ